MGARGGLCGEKPVRLGCAFGLQVRKEELFQEVELAEWRTCLWFIPVVRRWHVQAVFSLCQKLWFNGVSRLGLGNLNGGRVTARCQVTSLSAFNQRSIHLSQGSCVRGVPTPGTVEEA